MRYRPFAHFRYALSAVTLALTDDQGPKPAAHWERLVYAALENGINSFELASAQPALAEALGQALKAVDRTLVFVSARLGSAGSSDQTASPFSTEALEGSVRSLLDRTGLGYLDMAMLDDPAADELGAPAMTALKARKSQGEIRFLGVAGEDEAIDAYISAHAFDALATPFNVQSGWRERNRIRAATENDMAAIGLEPYPARLNDLPGSPTRPRGLFGAFRQKTAPGPTSPFAFLHAIPDWTAEQVCLAYALTEPALATVQVCADSVDRLVGLAAVPERDLPAGLGSQIEMARSMPAPRV